MIKKAFITGVTGQDGSYLAELLLSKGYEVWGIRRRSSSFNTARIDHIYDNPNFPRFKALYGDLADSSNLSRIIEKVEPDEIYNLGAQSHILVSFDMPEYTANVSGIGALRILDAIKETHSKTKFYQASSSEMFGNPSVPPPYNENTSFSPQSPYACAKVFAYYITKHYREAYNMFAINGILFNHESERRGETFVTRKITQGLARIKLGLQKRLILGNLDAKRDWGYAPEYVEAMYLMMQHKKPDDFVIATGEAFSVRDFIETAAMTLGIKLAWKGKGIQEKGINRKNGRVMIEISPKYFRPSDPAILLGDYSKAKKELGWNPKVKFAELVDKMIKHDYDSILKTL
jgi:GDPmannose 4,6-dehydratase